MPKKEPLKTVEVTVWKNHTHQGKPVKPGEKITVSVVQQAFLQSEGVLTKPEEGAENV